MEHKAGAMWDSQLSNEIKFFTHAVHQNYAENNGIRFLFNVAMDQNLNMKVFEYK